MDFVCPEIQKYLKVVKNVNCLSREFRLSGGCECDVRVCIDVEKVDVEYNLEKIMDYVVNVTEWISSLYWSSKTVSKLSIIIYLTPFRKQWMLKIPDLGVCQVNSGSTEFIGLTKRLITVWRAEDWSKVLLHELFHAFNWDRLVPKSHNTNDNELQSEALVEIMATVIHCQLLGGSQWKTLLNQQKQWSLDQVYYLSFYPWKPKGTSVKSYYIIKTALLLSLEQYFYPWIKQNNLQLCQQSWPKMIQQSLETLDQYLTNHPKPISNNSFISMRMIYHQLSLNPTLLYSK